MNGCHRYLTMAAVALLLAGCAGRQTPAPIDKASHEHRSETGQQSQPQPVSPPPPVTAPGTVTGVPAVPKQPGPIEQPAESPERSAAPKVRHYTWSSAVVPLVGKMVNAGGVASGSVLMVDNVNNWTNGTIQTDLATDALRSALAGSKFTLVGARQLAEAKRHLGLSPQDSLGTLSKALGLARSVGAQYLLYSSANGSAAEPTLKMQLMMVRSGEIIWSGSDAVR